MGPGSLVVTLSAVDLSIRDAQCSDQPNTHITHVFFFFLLCLQLLLLILPAYSSFGFSTSCQRCYYLSQRSIIVVFSDEITFPDQANPSKSPISVTHSIPFQSRPQSTNPAGLSHHNVISDDRCNLSLSTTPFLPR